ncbi:MAG: MerR family transcriptional regulator [Propionibacteriaceae bacterium]|jgi:DNA-binding transcriptional MerR regulator|nr:MerR family transcriptional regulator [Propionibacteriaceae bacterium]
MFRIGDFSKLGRVSVRTLRFYDEEGLLAPASVDEWTGYRYYTTKQLYELHRIVGLRQLGFSIDQIRSVLQGKGADLIDAKLQELENAKSSVDDQISRLKHYQQKGCDMEYQVVVKDIPAHTIFAAKRTIPSYANLGEIIPGIGAKIAAENPDVCCTQPEYMFVSYLDGEYKERDIAIECCQAVTKFGKDGDDYEFRTDGPLTVASVLHKGSYDGLRVACAFLLEWIGANGYRPQGFLRESYIDGVWNKQSEDEWLTEIQVPVAKG